jgi:hypothetical protein
VRSESDSVVPISAPNTGPDPRTAHQLDPPDPRVLAPTAPLTGLDPRASHRLPAPDGHVGLHDRDPGPDANSGPGFDNGGIQTMSAGAGTDAGSGIGPMRAEPDGAGGGAGGYGVDSVQMGQMADELDLAALILEKADKGLSESDATARMHSMLTAGGMLRSTTTDWDAEVTRLAKQCRTLADKLRRTHTNYATQEFRTAQDFQAILASTEGGA